MKLFLLFGLLAAATAEDTSLLTTINDAFTAKLFNVVLEDNEDKSVILSAFSVLPPLAQLALASEGESHDELLRAIGLPNDSVTKEVFQSVNARLRAVKGVDLRMASRIYVAKDAELNPSFAELSRDVFGSDVKNVNFGENIKTAQEVNTWVEEQTNHKIKNLVDANALDALTRAVLVNAIYFKGSWKEKFDKERTKDGDFHITKGQTVKVPFMHKTATFRYAESSELNAKLLELPYEGNQSSFLIVLPNEIDGLKSLEEKMKDPAVLRNAALQMHDTEVIVSLPKFKIETKTNLKAALKKIDINKLFDANEAKLNKLLNKESNLYISDAIQKAFIEVTEEGAEAAAANALFLAAKSSRAFYGPLFTADRPFYYALKFDEMIIFSGVYVP